MGRMVLINDRLPRLTGQCEALKLEVKFGKLIIRRARQDDRDLRASGQGRKSRRSFGLVSLRQLPSKGLSP